MSSVETANGSGCSVFGDRSQRRLLRSFGFSSQHSLILGALLPGPKRYSQLRIEVGGISEKMLAQTLRALERDGLILRESFRVVPPHVEYELTVHGGALADRVYQVVVWIEGNLDRFEDAQ